MAEGGELELRPLPPPPAAPPRGRLEQVRRRAAELAQHPAVVSGAAITAAVATRLAAQAVRRALAPTTVRVEGRILHEVHVVHHHVVSLRD